MNATFNVLESENGLLAKQSQLVALLSYLSQKQGNVRLEGKQKSVKARIRTAQQFLLDNLFEEVSLDKLASLVDMSPFLLYSSI